MKTNPSSFFLTSYNLSFKEAALCLLSGFHCFPFAVRHFEMADMDESYSLAHKSIAILESIPIIGLITALIERICALAFSFFKPTSAAQTQSSNHESNIYATIDALESNLYLGSLDHCPYNASVLKLSNNKIKVVKYNSWESYSYNQSQIRNYLAKNWEQIEPLLTSVKAMRNVAHIFHYHHFNATTSVTRSELSKKTDVLSWGIPQLMNVGLSFKQSKQICLKEPDETEKLVRGLVEIFNQASGQMKIKLFKTYFKFNSQEEIKLNHQLVDSFNKVYKHFGDIHRSKAENWLTYLLEKICLDPGLDLIGNFIKNPKKISMVWSHCNKCKLSEKDILEILTNFNFDGLEVGDSIIKDVDLIIKIYSTPSFAKIKENLINQQNHFASRKFFAMYNNLTERGVSEDKILNFFEQVLPRITLADLMSTDLIHFDELLRNYTRLVKRAKEGFMADLDELMTKESSKNNREVIFSILAELDSEERKNIANAISDLFTPCFEDFKTEDLLKWTDLQKHEFPISQVITYMKSFISEPKTIMEVKEDLRVFFKILNDFCWLYDEWSKNENPKETAAQKLEVLCRGLDRLKRYRKIPEPRIDGARIIEDCFPSRQWSKIIFEHRLQTMNLKQLEKLMSDQSEYLNNLIERWDKYYKIPSKDDAPTPRRQKSARNTGNTTS